MKPLTKQEARDRGYSVLSFHNGDYLYRIDNTEHLIRNDKEIAAGYSVYSYDNGDYSYIIDGDIYIFNKHGKKISL